VAALPNLVNQDQTESAIGKHAKQGESWERLTKTSLGFGMAAIILAATISFSQVLATLIMWTPSRLRL